MAYHDKPVESKDHFLFEYREVSATPHFHITGEFIFLREGKLSTTINGETHILKTGDACFCPGFSIHAYQSLSDTNKAYVVGVQKKFLDKFFLLFQKKVPPTFFHFDDYQLLDFLFKICNTHYSEYHIKQHIFESAIQMLYLSIANQCDFVEQRQDTHDALVSKVLNYATENYNKPLTLDVLSKEFGYARETLSRILNKFLGESWNSYVNRIRAYKAQNILYYNPNKSISEILYECGFNSPNTFYRAFIREFGIHPRVYAPKTKK